VPRAVATPQAPAMPQTPAMAPVQVIPQPATPAGRQPLAA